MLVAFFQKSNTTVAVTYFHVLKTIFTTFEDFGFEISSNYFWQNCFGIHFAILCYLVCRNASMVCSVVW